jgi:cellobiose phosphorylase
VIPQGWAGFQAVRRFRGVTYRIAVERRGPGNRVALRVDGQPIAGDIVPLPPEGTREVYIEAVLD